MLKNGVVVRLRNDDIYLSLEGVLYLLPKSNEETKSNRILIETYDYNLKYKGIIGGANPEYDIMAIYDCRKENRSHLASAIAFGYTGRMSRMWEREEI